MKNITTKVKRMYNELTSDMERFEDVMLNTIEELVTEFWMNLDKIFIISWLTYLTGCLVTGFVGIIFGMAIFCIPMFVTLLIMFVISFFIEINSDGTYDDIVYKR